MLALSSLGPPSFAQTPEPDPPVVCLADAFHWSGSPQETKTNQSPPVPESFTRPHGDGAPGCESSAPLSDLLAWHLSFGTEASALAAADAYAPSRFGFPKSNARAELMKSWQAALRETQRAEKEAVARP